MARKPQPGAPAWMATFADLSTLLMCFFVLLLSFSEMDIQKYKQVMGSMREAFGVQRDVFARDNPMGTSIVAREFSPGKPDPSPFQVTQQQTAPQVYAALKTDGIIESEDIFDPQRQVDLKAPAEPVDLRDEERRLRAALAEEIEAGLVEVERRGPAVLLRIPEQGSFPSGRADLIEPFSPVIRKIAAAMAPSHSEIIITGHTDDLPIATSRFRSNWELSAARAVTVLERLLAAAELTPDRFVVQGLAETEPAVPNDTPERRARNRRVDIIILEADQQTTKGPGNWDS
ncbi:MAG TPA: MotB family protein [Gammaproteobacteria bacterium]|nr:MotB family protein [Gammaproteobacteria bacterium]